MKSPFEATLTINFIVLERTTRLASIALQQILKDPFQKPSRKVLRNIAKARRENKAADKWLNRRFK